jgi:flagellar hook assembly protein FlgD
MPYQIAKDADVTVRIFDVKGQLIRAIVLGRKKAGFYISRNRAAYWDGRNQFGEQVSSGVYFYVLHAGDFTATRNMVIMK